MYHNKTITKRQAVTGILSAGIFAVGIFAAFVLTSQEQDIRQQAAFNQTQTIQMYALPRNTALTPNQTARIAIEHFPGDQSSVDAVQLVMQIEGTLPTDLRFEPNTDLIALKVIYNQLTTIDANKAVIRVVLAIKDPSYGHVLSDGYSTLGHLVFTTPASGTITLNFQDDSFGSKLVQANTQDNLALLPTPAKYVFASLPANNQVSLLAPGMTLSTSNFYLVLGDRIYTMPTQPTITADPNVPGKYTVTWEENGATVTMVYTFGSDGNQWWLEKVEASDSLGNNATFSESNWPRVPVSQTLTNQTRDLYTPAINQNQFGHIHFSDLALQAFIPTATVTPTATPTEIPTTPTPTPVTESTPTPTPSATPGLGYQQLQLKVVFAGVTMDRGPIKALVKIKPANMSTVVLPNQIFTYLQDNIYLAQVAIPESIGGIDVDTMVSIAIKGEKHTQTVFPSIIVQSEVINLTDRLQRPGDLPIQNVQDGVIDLSDLNLALEAIAKPTQTIDDLAADVNFDGVVNAFDVSQILATLASKNDEPI